MRERKNMIRGFIYTSALFVVACLPQRPIEGVHQPGESSSIVASAGNLDPRPEGVELTFTLLCSDGTNEYQAIGEVSSVGENTSLVFSGEKTKDMIDGQTCALEAWGPKRDELEYSDAADGSGRMLYYITSKDKLMNRKLVLVYGARYRKIDNTRPLYNIAINMTLEPQSNSGLKSVKLSCVRQAGNQADDSFDLLPNGIQNLDVVFSVKKSLLGGDGTKTRCTSITAITEDGDAYETTVDLELNRSHRQNISKNLTLRPVGGGEIAISLENIDQLLKGTFASECLGLEENKSRYHFHFEEIPDSINKIKMSWWVLNYEDSSNCQNKTGRTTKGSVYDYNLTLQRDISQYGFIFQADFIPAPSNPSVYMLIKLDSNSDDIKTHILKGRSLSASGDSREFIAPMITPNISQFETQGPALQILTKSPEQ